MLLNEIKLLDLNTLSLRSFLSTSKDIKIKDMSSLITQLYTQQKTKDIIMTQKAYDFTKRSTILSF